MTMLKRDRGFVCTIKTREWGSWICPGLGYVIRIMATKGPGRILKQGPELN